MKVTLPDGRGKEYEGQVTALQVAAEIGEGLAKATIGARVTPSLDNDDESQLIDAGRPIRDQLV